jgi:Mrp family chromosome partitioning ATPase
MERLQAAIEKARTRRQDTRMHPSAPRPDTSVTGVEAVWASLAAFEVYGSKLRKNRLVAFESGPEAAPYDMLRTRILQQAQKNNWRRVAIVSPHAGCGKTTTAANLVFSFSRQKDLRCIILDLDLRRIGLGKTLDQKRKYSMADVLERRVSFAEHGLCYGTNVAVGLNSTPANNPSELLQSQQTRDVLAEIEAAYQPNLMIFDMPPLMSSDDNYGFLKNVDCALILAEADTTTIEQVDVAERQVAELTNVLGVVLNKCRYNEGAYGYE